MDEVALRRMTCAEFFEWEPGDDERYELVDGQPIMMTGASAGHDQIVVNALTELRVKLRASAYRTFTDDIAVVIPNGNVRRPDVGVNNGRLNRRVMQADNPCLVIEVLSPSTRDFDMFVKLDEYKTVETLQHIILLDLDTPRAIHWSRAEDRAWRHRFHEGLEAVIEIPEPRLALGLAALYEDVEFTPPPATPRP